MLRLTNHSSPQILLHGSGTIETSMGEQFLAHRLSTIVHSRGLDSLERTIDRYMIEHQNSVDELFLLQAINDWLAIRSNLESVVEAILADDQRRDWCRESSSINPNGFYRVMLLEGKYFKCRAHVWTEAKFGIEKIHDHKSNFASHVLRGGYSNVFYEPGEEGSPGQYEAYVIHAADAARSIHRAQPQTLRFQGMQRLRERSSFVMPDYVLHRLQHVFPFTLTVTTRGCVKEKQCRVFSDVDTQLLRPESGLSVQTFTEVIRQLRMYYLYETH